ncbi:MAG TPA: DinB family protein [Longimicrobium sp.]|nr:DinB family protein [Longimicrobium sp.]
MGTATLPGADDRRANHRWETACDEHQVALAAYLDTAAAVADEAWTRPWAPGKWTPAQITEHLSLAYEAGLTEIATGQGMKEKLHGWRQRVTRWVFLPHILFHRSFPVRARSPREIRPPETPALPRPEALRRLRELGERFEVELDRARRSGGGRLTHPYFGKIEPVKGMRFFAVHLEHHARQVARAK